MTVVIKGSLTSSNKLNRAQRANKYKGAKLKKQETERCRYAFLPIKSKKLKLPIELHIDWYAKDRRTDPDNIASAKKFILDGMVTSGLLKNDGWGEIVGFRDNFYVDAKNPRIEVKIIESK